MNTSVLIRASAAASVLAMSAGASAAIVSFTSRAAWEAAPQNTVLNMYGAPMPSEVKVQDLNDLSPTFTGGSGWESWSAEAADGSALQQLSPGARTTSGGTMLELTFGGAGATGPVGPLGVGLDVAFFDAAGNRTSGRMYVRLANGSGVVRTFTATDSFVGFWSKDLNGPIAGLTIEPRGTTAATSFVGITGLALATVVPAPGSISLLAAAAVIGWRRRRA
jgi:hypothetical protein